MNFRLLFVALCLLASSVFATPQEQAQDNLLLIEGRTEAAPDCPVLLSDARSWRPRVLTKQDGSQEVRMEVKIQNVSGKAIRRAVVIFREDNPEGGQLNHGTATNPIKTHETLVLPYKYRTGTSGKPIEDYNGIFSVLVPAVEFADGTHWVRPSTADIFITRTALSQRSVHLFVRECKDIDTNYHALLETNSDKVVAYRLGVVKDTPTSYEVRVGSWIRMAQPSTPRQTRFEISATDEQISLPQAQIFQREKLRYERLSGRVSAELGGVALFVAEVELADGTVWKQNLTRDELMWGLYD